MSHHGPGDDIRDGVGEAVVDVGQGVGLGDEMGDGMGLAVVGEGKGDVLGEGGWAECMVERWVMMWGWLW